MIRDDIETIELTKSSLIKWGETTRPINKLNNRGDADIKENQHSVFKTDWEKDDIILDLYKVRGLAGKGGMGKVYKVYHINWNIDLVVKTPIQKFLKNKILLEHFKKEAETWVSLVLHPNVVTCYYVRNINGIPRIFAEYVDGGSLQDWIENKNNIGQLYSGNRRTVLGKILDISIQIAWGLQHAHDNGLVHQDIKPSNIMMRSDGIAKVTDFGLANFRALAHKNIMPDKDTQFIHYSNSKNYDFTFGGGFTRAFCSPEQVEKYEQIKNKIDKEKITRITHKTDIWSWALSIIYMFTRKLIWESGDLGNKAFEKYLLLSHKHQSLPEIPDSLVSILKKCLSLKVRERPNSIGDLSQKLVEIYEIETGMRYPRKKENKLIHHSSIINNRALSNLDLGKPKEAFECLKQGLENFSNNLQLTYNHELFLWKTGKRTDMEVIGTLESLRERVPDKALLNFLISLIFIEKGDAKNAIKNLKRAVRIEKCILEIWEHLAEAQMGTNDIKAALETLKTLQSLNPDNISVRSLNNYLKKENKPPEKYKSRFWSKVEVNYYNKGEHKIIGFHEGTKRIIVLRNSDHRIDIVDKENSTLSQISKNDFKNIKLGIFSKDGELAAIIWHDFVSVWNIKEESLRYQSAIPESLRGSALTSPLLCNDGTLLFSKLSSLKQKASLYINSDEMQEFSKLIIEPSGNIKSMDQNPRTNKILTSSIKGICSLWNINSGFGNVFYHNPSGVFFAKFNHDNVLIIIGSGDGAITVGKFVKDNFKIIRQLHIDNERPISAALNSHNSLMVTIHQTKLDLNLGTIRIWDFVIGRCLSSLNDINVEWDSKIFIDDNESTLGSLFRFVWH